MPAVLQAYESLITAGELRPDPEQAAAAARLDALAHELENPKTTGFFRKKVIPAAASTCGAMSAAANPC